MRSINQSTELTQLLESRKVCTVKELMQALVASVRITVFCKSQDMPEERRQTQIDGRRVECVGRIFQLEPQSIYGAQLSCDPNQPFRELAVRAAVAPLVRQIAAYEVAMQSELICLGKMRCESRFDIPQALPKSDLRERLAQGLAQATEGTDVKLPRYLTTKRRKVGQGAKSITWVKAILSVYIQICRKNSATLRYLASELQVVTAGIL